MDGYEKPKRGGKRKRVFDPLDYESPYEVYEDASAYRELNYTEPPRRSFCAIVILLSMAALLGGAAGVLVINRDARNQSSTETVQVMEWAWQTQSALTVWPIPTQPSSHTPLPPATSTPSPTSRPVVEQSATPTPTASLVPPTRRPSSSRASSGLQTFLQANNIPLILDIGDLSCQETRTSFTLYFLPDAETDYFIVSLETWDNTDYFVNVDIHATSDERFARPILFAINGAPLELDFPLLGAALGEAFQRRWTVEQNRGPVTSFSVTWRDTADQPPIFFDIVVSHTVTGGVSIKPAIEQGATSTEFPVCAA